MSVDSIPVRVCVLDPLPGVMLAVQHARNGLLRPSASSTSTLCVFDFSLRLGRALADGRPNFLGDFAHGTRDARFVYVNAGTLAGQSGTCWQRRAKLMLDTVTRAQVDALLGDPGKRLEGHIGARARDGGPACARVPIIGGWQVVAS